MDFLRLNLIKIGITVSLLSLISCSQSIVVDKSAVIDNKNKSAISSSAPKPLKSDSYSYLCKDNKKIQIQKVTTKRKKKGRTETIILSFNGTSERLTRSISESGRNYSNIHWHWLERTPNSRLTNTIGEILAEQCVKQS